MVEDNPPPRGSWRNPPEQHRFGKGVSGNPKGRPRKVRPAAVHPLDMQAEDLALKEAYRTITLKEGGKPVTLPMLEAVLRATSLAALKGSAHAQRTFLQLVLPLELRRIQEHASHLGEALFRKEELQLTLDWWKQAGRAEAEFPMHPDDIEIDHQTGDVRNFVTITSEQREARRRVLQLRDELHRENSLLELAIKLGQSNEEIRERLTLNQQIAVDIEGLLPTRLRQSSP